MRNKTNVYVWIELKKGFILPEIEREIIKRLNDSNQQETDYVAYEKSLSYFLRTPTWLIDDCYYFSMFTAGWQNPFYRIHLEIDPSQDVELITSDDPKQIYQEVEQYKLGVMSFGDACLIYNERHYLKMNNYMVPSTLYATFVFTQKKIVLDS